MPASPVTEPSPRVSVCDFVEPRVWGVDELKVRWRECPQCINRFSWRNFSTYDRYARSILEAMLPADFSYLDVTPMTAARPDSHTAIRFRMGAMPPDCLHHTLPGVPDYWWVLLLHTLRSCARA